MKFQFGDRVRHSRRPEWGIGSIVKVEDLTVNGELAQRVSVRFPNAGLKTMSSAHAELQLAPSDDGETAAGEAEVDWEKVKDSDWLGDVARRKVEEAMVGLSAEIRDPFNSLRHRLRACLDLFRFERTGRSLIDWAVAQSGLADPLSRFTRHELEQFFEQWAAQRESHLERLLQEAAAEPAMVRELVAGVAPAAAEAVRRLTAAR